MSTDIEKKLDTLLALLSQHNPDLPTQFPHLQHVTDGNFHYHLSIDKSVSKLAGWVIGVMVGAIVIAVLAVAWAGFSYSQASKAELIAQAARHEAIKADEIAQSAHDRVGKAEIELKLIDDWMAVHKIRKGKDGKYHFEEKPYGE